MKSHPKTDFCIHIILFSVWCNCRFFRSDSTLDLNLLQCMLYGCWISVLRKSKSNAFWYVCRFQFCLCSIGLLLHLFVLVMECDMASSEIHGRYNSELKVCVQPNSPDTPTVNPVSQRSWSAVISYSVVVPSSFVIVCGPALSTVPCLESVFPLTRRSETVLSPYMVDLHSFLLRHYVDSTDNQ